MKIEWDLLEAFKIKARLDGVPYQTRIKQIMRDWLKKEG
jgi:predicted DNA binding CopG/RHH family protein